MRIRLNRIPRVVNEFCEIAIPRQSVHLPFNVGLWLPRKSHYIISQALSAQKARESEMSEQRICSGANFEVRNNWWSLDFQCLGQTCRHSYRNFWVFVVGAGKHGVAAARL